MKPSLLEYLVCPKSQTLLELENPAYDEKGNIRSGALISKVTRKRYRIIDGVPVILDEVGAMSTTEKAFGRQWRLHAKGLFEKGKIFGRDETTCLKHIRDYFDIPIGDSQSRKLFIDAGCGLAPYAKTFAKNFPQATAFGLDMSESVMYVNADELPNLHVIRCDLREPPLRKGLADIIWSYGVLHHTPNTEDAFRALQQYVRSEGKVYIWVYSQHNTKYSFLARKFLYKPYLLPGWVNYLLSFLIAIPVFVVYRAHYLVRSLDPKTKPLLKKHPYLNIATGIHDSLVPEYQSYHTRDEVKSWFSSSGFGSIRVVGDIGVVGTKEK